MFPSSIKINFSNYTHPKTHYKVKEIERDIERIWPEAIEYNAILEPLIAQFKEEEENSHEDGWLSSIKPFGNGLYDMTEAVNEFSRVVVDQILVAKGWMAFDWLRATFLASFSSNLPSVYPVFLLSSELAKAVEATELPEVNLSNIKWFSSQGHFILKEGGRC